MDNITVNANEESGEGEQPSLEEQFAEIEGILAQMEQQDVPLDATFALYQQGMERLRTCTRLLDETEKKLQVLEADVDLA